MLKEKNKAPQFSLPDAEGNTKTLKDFQGKKVIVYFYPKDSTPGCTKESIEFSQSMNEITKKNGVVVGISKDSQGSHQKFIKNNDLKVNLLSDTETKVIQDYGVWQEKKNYGRTYMGIVRSTFLIDEKGFISKIWPKVKVDGHVQEVVSCL